MTKPRPIRDPLWGNICLDRDAAEIVDTVRFQRLRHVKQLGLTDYVFPGAVHSRFLHALGVYHLVGRAITVLEQGGHLDPLTEDEVHELPLVRLAALLHDVGHYAFSHTMEELGPGILPGAHEEVGARYLTAPTMEGVFSRYGEGAAERVAEIIQGRSQHPLQGLVAGPCDLDKVDYLSRDALFCGVPYGTVEVDHLLGAFTLGRESAGAPWELAVAEKGFGTMEALLIAKYQMFRSVYWHHGVRAATAAFLRLIRTSLECGLLQTHELVGPTDNELLALLTQRLDGSWEGDPSGAAPAPAVSRAQGLLAALRHRRLPKRVIEIAGDQLPRNMSTWPLRRPDLVEAAELWLAREWGMPEGSLMLDYPTRPRLFDLGALLIRRDGGAQRLTGTGARGLIEVPVVGYELLHSAKVLRVFACDPPGRQVDRDVLLGLVESTEAEIDARFGLAGHPVMA